MTRPVPLCLLLMLLCGCSARDPHTDTPSYHAGPQTGSSAPINSWEVGQTPPPPPAHARSPFAPEPSQRGYEPYDALALRVYAALQNDNTVPLKYVTVTAKGGAVRLVGTVETAPQAAHLAQVARRVAGVGSVQSRLRVAVP